ncbi:ribosome biogenesis protein WDR12-like isoform X2 [Asterias rubens]|nr:ribosome biogenesis protein WDR12-like isoform X2 [Asterias rubens]
METEVTTEQVTDAKISGYGSHLQVRFITKQECYSVGDTPFSVPASVGVSELSSLINKLLDRESEDSPVIDFDFLIDGEFLRVALGHHLEEKSTSTESVVEIEYLEKHPAPKPAGSILHDDWVSCVQGANNRIVTGSYDNNVRLWTEDGENLVIMHYHSDPVKTVTWIKRDDAVNLLVSGSMDQTLLIWEWDEQTKKHKCLHSCRGHAKSVETVAVDQSQTKIASGSMDSMLKIWSAVPGGDDEEVDEIQHKKARTDGHKPLTRTPLRTFDGHTQGISSLVWLDEKRICTASWDHTMKIWDMEQEEQVTTLTGNKVFHSVAFSPLSNLLATGSSDRHIRLWDPRQNDGLLVKSSLSHHTGWVSSVAWSPDNANLLISGSYDKTLKLWDTRSPKAPLYNMSGLEDKILAVDWSQPELMLCGGADNALHIFKAADALQAAES